MTDAARNVGETTSTSNKMVELNVPRAPRDLQIVDIGLGKKDDSWKEFNLAKAPVYLIGKDGQFYESQRYAMVLRDDKPAAIVSRRYALLPNERVIEEVAKAANGDFEPLKARYSKDGNQYYGYWVSNDKAVSVAKGDNVKLGFMVRNSIDGSTGLGVELMTFRVICSNGAVVGKDTLASAIGRRHIGQVSLVIKDLQSKLKEMMRVGRSVLDVYRSWTKMDLNKRIAENLAEALPKKYIPEYIKQDKLGRISLESTPTLWQTFNDMTESIWHEEKLQPKSANWYLQQAHDALLAPQVRA